MTSQEKVLGYLGLAARGRNVDSGEFSTEKAVRAGRAYLVVTAGDASDNTKKNFRNMCEYYHVPYLELADKQTIGRALGKVMRASCAVTDENLAKAIIKVTDQKE